MLKIYVPYSNMDWLNYKLVRKDLTFHHIRKREDGGKATIDNGALLMPVGHQYLHLIEYKDIETYIANEIMKNEVAKKILEEILSKYKEIIGANNEKKME